MTRDRAESNRLVVHDLLRRLDRDPDFHGRIVLSCEAGRIVHHRVERTYLTSDVLDRLDVRSGRQGEG